MTDKTLERDTFPFVQIPFPSQWFSEAIWDAKRANVYEEKDFEEEEQGSSLN